MLELSSVNCNVCNEEWDVAVLHCYMLLLRKRPGQV